ncbi:type II secretion system protein, partial [Desulfitobacterium sp.]
MVKRRKDSGFTLIELMIVIAVIGILAVVLVPKV